MTAVTDLEHIAAPDIVTGIIYHKPFKSWTWEGFHDDAFRKAVEKASEEYPVLKRILDISTKTDGITPGEPTDCLDRTLGNMHVCRLLNHGSDFRCSYINFHFKDSLKKNCEKMNGEGSWDALKPVADAIWKEYKKLEKAIAWWERPD